ncbi:MAG: cell division protein ZapA [Candidatus Eisenbacteria bacterium]|nr:cell division protein ZapA [Candidatus Eisenbacteria bacterium]
MDSAETTRIKILGEEYRIQGDSDAGEIAELAGLVEQTLRELMEASPVTDSKRLAVLAALNIAQRLRREQHHNEEALSALREKVEALNQRLARTLEDVNEGSRAVLS